MAYNAIITGRRSSDNGVVSTNKKPDIDTVLKRLEPYQTPMMQWLFFSNKASKEVRNKDGKYEWYETEYLPHQGTVSAAVTASTTLTLTSSNFSSISIFQLYDVVYIEETDEQAYVSSVTAGGGSDVVLSHIDGSSSLTSLASTGAYIKIVGAAQLEYTTPIISNTVQEVNKYAYLQKFLGGIATTGRDEAGDAYTDGTDHAAQVQVKMAEMKIMYERAFIYNLTTGRYGSGVNARTWTKGMLGYVSSNVTDNYGTLTETIWDNYLSDVLSKGSNHKLHLCGKGQLGDINKIFKDKTTLSANIETEYGVTIQKYRHGQGFVDIAWDPVLDGKFVDWGITIDIGLKGKPTRARHMANDKQGSRKFRIQANVQTPGADSSQTQLLADLGFEYPQEETAGVLSKY